MATRSSAPAAPRFASDARSGSGAHPVLNRLVAGIAEVRGAAELLWLRHALRVAIDERNEARRDARLVVARLGELESQLADAHQILAGTSLPRLDDRRPARDRRVGTSACTRGRRAAS